MLLPIAVNAPHTLFQACRVPGDIVVDHEPADLEVDTFPCCIGRYQVHGPTLFHGPTEGGNLFLALLVVHPTMNLGNLACEAHSFQAMHQEV